MKKRLFWIITLVLSAMLAITPAHATTGDQTIEELLQGFGMSEAETEAFAGLIADMGGSITEDDIRQMLAEFTQEGTGDKLPGTTVDGTYTDPDGYSFKIPQDWTLQENQIGPTVVLTGPVTEKGFMPTITILVLEGTTDEFLTMTQAQIDELLSASLKNYLPVALDDFEFLDFPAREMVCMYGENEDSMLMQYQLYFNNQASTYIITMTTLAEEAEHEQTLDTYDAFLAEFALLSDSGNG